MADSELIEVRQSNSCSAFSEEEFSELEAIAQSYIDATGLLMKLVEVAAKAAGRALEELPRNVRKKFDELVFRALEQAYDAALWTNRPGADNASWMDRVFGWAHGEAWHAIAVTVAGAFGGAGGMVTTVAELPVTTILILRSIQEAAASLGFDPSDPWVRRQCVVVFGLSGSLEEQIDAELGFFAVRLAAGRGAIAQVLRMIASRFGIVVSEKFLADATPVLGIGTGAFVNFTFIRFYQKMARVHFRLLAIEESHDRDQVRSCFERILAALRPGRE